MIAGGVNLSCKNSIILERAGAGKERREKQNMRIMQDVAALIVWRPLDDGEAPSNDSGVT